MVSGLGLLLLMTIATGGILVTGILSTFLAAIASMALIYSEVYLSFTTNSPGNQYLQVGLLGVLLFLTSLYLQMISERMRRAAALTEQQASSIVDLEKLNDLVIQRLRTGIIVVDNDNHILTRNSAAENLLSLNHHRLSTSVKENSSLAESGLPTKLKQQLENWKRDNQTKLPAFKVRRSGPQLQASFIHLNPKTESNILIFVDDNSQFLQRARQLKLASLGRLTASIAHEIRNPLGAISHATQLLKESENINNEDQRFIEIVLSHSARVNLIIEDILQMSRHPAQRPEKINLYDWLRKFVQVYQASHSINGDISLEIRPRGTVVRVITNQLEQILTNLFENGLRYSIKGTGVASLTIRGGSDVILQTSIPFLHIIDDGPGVSARAEEHLFEPFHTTESTGTGLGLYISKELCEANQAQLIYKRTRKGKSCFSIYFSHPDRNIN
jgi:two-component system sensor histidine kinase PilS (NtrC family)